jgi:hypothetical protein
MFYYGTCAASWQQGVEQCHRIFALLLLLLYLNTMDTLSLYERAVGFRYCAQHSVDRAPNTHHAARPLPSLY